jgi:hypothetical protein
MRKAIALGTALCLLTVAAACGTKEGPNPVATRDTLPPSSTYR